MSGTRTRRPARRPAPVLTPAHLSAEQAAVWGALRLAVEAAGGLAVPVHAVLGPLRAIDPGVAGQALRVELLLEALAVDPRTTVVAEQELGGGPLRYRA